MLVGDVTDLLKSAYKLWTNHKAARLGAALAYYTIFSLAPLLIIAIAVAGTIFGQEAAQGQIAQQIQTTVGPEAAKGIQEMLVHAAKPGANIVATIIGVGTLILGASGVFGQLQDAMNTIWDVPQAPNGGILKLIRDRFLSFTMVLGTCFLLMVSLLVSAGLSAASHMIGGPAVSPLFQVLDFVLATAIVAVLFALLFKYMPDTPIAWSDVWHGALFTALLFSLGKFLLGLYLGRAGVASAYGAAGSLIVILLWVYYAAQILFFGAEFTRAYAQKFGSLAPARR